LNCFECHGFSRGYLLINKVEKIQYDNILKKLKSLSNPRAVEGMAKYGITPDRVCGVSIPNLRKMAKEIGKNHDLAQQLWASGIHEALILASMIDDPTMVTGEQMESWAVDFDSWDICDQCCSNLFDKTEFAYQKAVEWSSREGEFVKRAGFVLMACLAVHDKKAEDKQFERFLSIVKREATDNRNYVKKAVNWALRQIGKRNLNLNRKAIETAKEIQKIHSRSAKWIASDAIRELKSKAVQERLVGK
jgi:3-methyladenine DNA glycosylase AlkD